MKRYVAWTTSLCLLFLVQIRAEERMKNNSLHALDEWTTNYFKAYAQGDRDGLMVYGDSLEKHFDQIDELTRAKIRIMQGRQEEILESLGAMAQNGNPEAMYYYGVFLLQKTSEINDPKTGFKWIKKAAKSGYFRAHKHLYSCYLLGEGTPKNSPLALRSLRLMAETKKAEFVDEQVILARYYQLGEYLQKDPAKALKWFTIAAKNGSIYSQLVMGTYYGQCQNNKQVDPKKSFEYFKMAADQGDVDAIAMLGILYQKGIGTEKDIQAAISYYSLAAEAGNFISQNTLGEILYTGKEVKKNYREALKWYRMAAVNNNVQEDNPEKLEAGYRIARIHLNSPAQDRNYGETFHWLQKLVSENNYTDAYTDYAYCLHWGYGTEKNIDKAIEWYKKSAELDNAYAMEQLGRLYTFSPPPLKNPAVGNEWFSKASERGRDSSTRYLATNYLSGNGVKKDSKKGFDMLTELANKEYYPAYYYLGQAYLNGRGTERNLTQAIIYLEKGSEKGNAACMNLLGTIHLNPKFQETFNYKKAIDYFEKAGEKGIPNSMYYLGRIYINGRGVPMDPTKGIEWLKKAALNGYKPAISDLGVVYLRGINGKQNVDSARHWFESVKPHELNASGLYHLGTMFEDGKGYPKSIETALELYKEAAAKKFPLAEQKVRLIEIQTKGDEAWQTLPLKDVYAEAAKTNPKAQYELYRRYTTGASGIEKSEKYARIWLERAARNGHPKAKKEIGNGGYRFKN